MKRSLPLIMICAFLALVLLSGCANQTNNAGAAKTSNAPGAVSAVPGDKGGNGEITIGASLSLSGSFTSSGKDIQRGYELAIEQINAKGGVMGKKLKLVYYDDESNADTVKKLYEKLITSDKVNFVLGPFSSGLTNVALTVSEKYGYSMVAPTATAENLYTSGFKGLFSVYPPANLWLPSLLDFAVKKGYKTMVILRSDEEQPKAITEGLRQKAKEVGINIVYEGTFTPKTQDYSSILGKVKNANPDIFVVPSYFEDQVQIVRQMKASNYAPKLFVETEGPNKPDFVKTLGKDADYVVSSGIWAPGKTEGSKEFVDSYKAKYNVDAGSVSALAYASVQLLQQGIEKAQSFDNAKIIEALHQLKTKTIVGEWAVDKTGKMTVSDIFYMQYQNGKQVYFWPEKSADVEFKETPAWQSRK